MRREVSRLFGSIVIVFGSIFACQSAGAAIVPGLIDDFEDGTLGGWAPPKANTSNIAGGPAGSTRALEISSANRLAPFDAGTDINGAIDSAVTAIEVDMMRLSDDVAPLEIRLALFGPGTGNRWTSTLAQTLAGDGLWSTYSFSILEADLTQVAGAGSYANLVGNLNRIMFRHDVGGPSAGGTMVDLSVDPFYIDNVRAVAGVPAIPVPAAVWLFGTALLGLIGYGKRRRAA